MAGVINNTARQFNLRAFSESGNKVTVRLAPGFNVVDDEHWNAFVSKAGVTTVAFLDELVKKGHIEFGKKVSDLELEKDPDTKSKSKSEPAPKSSKTSKK